MFPYGHIRAPLHKLTPKRSSKSFAERGFCTSLLFSSSPSKTNFCRLIPQTYSWGEFTISGEALKKLFTSLNVFAEFLDLVHAFGSKTSAVGETFASRPVFRSEGTSKSFCKHLRGLLENLS